MYDFVVNDAIIISSHNNFRPFVASLGVDNGTIVKIDKKSIPIRDAKHHINGINKVLMPGLTNAHCHGDMTVARGLGDNLSLSDQNKAFLSHGWFSEFLTDEDRIASRQLTYIEALRSGTTFIVENMFWGLGNASVRAMTEIGIRGALAEDIRYNFSEPDVFLSDHDLEEFAINCRNSGVIPMIGGISEEDFELQRLTNISTSLNKHKLPYTAHLAETRWRLDLIKQKFRTTPIRFLHQLGCLNENFLASHVVYPDESEIKLLKENGVKVVNTPLCEMKIQDGCAPIPAMYREGVCVCLGTDGALWNNSNDIFREMKGLLLLHALNGSVDSLKPKDALQMATINGARAFGLDADFGSIEIGKRADFILVDFDQAHTRPFVLGELENICSTLVYNVTGQDVTDVCVNGKWLIRDKKFMELDVKPIYQKVQNAAEKIRQKIFEKEYRNEKN